MNNKNYIYFFLSMCFCTAYGGGNSTYTLSSYDNADGEYENFFEDVLSVKSAPLSKKNHKKKRKSSADLTSDDLTSIQEPLKSRIAAQLQHVLRDAKTQKKIEALVMPFVKTASRGVEDVMHKNIQIAQMNAQSKVVPAKNDPQGSSMPKEVNEKSAKDVLELLEKQSQNTDTSKQKNTDTNSNDSKTQKDFSEIRYPDLSSYIPNEEILVNSLKNVDFNKQYFNETSESLINTYKNPGDSKLNWSLNDGPKLNQNPLNNTTAKSKNESDDPISNSKLLESY